MAEFLTIRDITATDSGGTSLRVGSDPLDSEFFIPVYRFSGSPTLTSDYDITASGTPVDNSRITILWEASVTLGGNDITFMGATIPSGWEDKNWKAEAVYNSGWTVFLYPDFQEGLFVLTDDIADENVTLAKIEDLTRGSLITGQTASNRPTALSLGSSGQFLVSDGTDLSYVSLSGDATLSAAGALTISAEKITNAKLAHMNANTVKVRDANSAGDPTDLEVTDTELLIGNGAGFTAATLSGDVELANTGAVTATHTDVRDIYADLSSATKVGDIKIYFPFKCTVTRIDVAAVDTFSTDDATFTPRNHAGSTMQDGASAATITVPATTSIGTVTSSTPDGNNTFAAGETMTLTTAKTTKDGAAMVYITYTRTS